MFIYGGPDCLFKNGTAVHVFYFHRHAARDKQFDHIQTPTRRRIVKTTQSGFHSRVWIDTFVQEILGCFRMTKHTRGGEDLVKRFLLTLEHAAIEPAHDLIVKSIWADSGFQG